MKINNISSELKFVNRIGQTISLEQRTILQTSFQFFNLWGRIQGILHNYYIVEGIIMKGQINFPLKKYFWSHENFQFAQLPQPRNQFIKEVIKNNNFFTGQHQKILIKNKQQSIQKINYNKQQSIQRINYNKQQIKIKNKNFTQLDRLSIVVKLIQYDCQIVPIGAYKMIPTHQLIFNPHFNGLKIDNAKNMQNYVHFKSPILPHKQLLIQCDQALQRDDFMDPITEDNIKQSWSIQTDESGTQITIRSLLWQGYIAYHRTNSTIFGGIYMGLGIKTHDLSFIL